MIEIFDVIRLTKDNPCFSGLEKGSEHYVGYYCKLCGMLGLVAEIEELGGVDKLLFVSDDAVEVIGEAPEEKRGHIREVAYRSDPWDCDHDRSLSEE